VFREVATRFGRYETMYAGLGAVVVFLAWLYIAGFAILMGGELNAEIERSAGILPEVSTPAAPSMDAAGHDTSIRKSFEVLPRARSIPGGPARAQGPAADR
jgi:membrane protein